MRIKALFICFLLVFSVYGQEGLLSKKQTDSLKADSNLKQAKDYLYNNPALSKKHARLCIEYANNAGLYRLAGAGNNSLGLCCRNLSEYDSAIIYFQKAEKLFRQAGAKSGYFNVMNNIAMTHFYLGDYEKSNAWLLEVIKEADKYNLYTVLSNAHQNLGIINNSQERFHDALENFKLAEHYHTLSGDERGRSGAAINQAYIYFKHLRQYDKAIAMYNREMPVKQKLRDEKGMGICYNNLAEIFLIKEDYTKATEAVNKAITIRQKLDDQLGLVNSYTILADIYYRQKKYKEAESTVLKGIAIAKDITAKKEHSEALRLLSKIQADNRDIHKAYESYVKSVSLKDSLLNKENFAKMAELEKKYESERKERQILLQRAKIAENQLKIDEQNNVIYMAFFLAAIIAMAGLLLYNRQKIKTVKIQKESELRDALLVIETQSKLQEQRLQISRDLHDNIGSQLTFIISSLDNLKYGFDISDNGLKERLAGIRNFTKDTITELRDTIWAMHKEEITVQDLKTRISNFIENAKAASRGITFTFDIDSAISDDVSFSSVTGVSLYRIIQEAVNNALKHADATCIHVGIEKLSDSLEVKISDNGCGFSTVDETTGNGINNIKKRAADFGGQADIVSTATGTVISVKV